MNLEKNDDLITSLLNNCEYEGALKKLDKLISDPNLKGKDYELVQKAHYASFYIHIVDNYLIGLRLFDLGEQYLKKATGIINSCDKKNNCEEINPFKICRRI